MASRYATSTTSATSATSTTSTTSLLLLLLLLLRILRILLLLLLPLRLLQLCRASSSLMPRNSHERGSATLASRSRPNHAATKSRPLHSHTPASLAEQPHRDSGGRAGTSLPVYLYCRPATTYATWEWPDRSSCHGTPTRVAGTQATCCAVFPPRTPTRAAARAAARAGRSCPDRRLRRHAT